MEQKLGRWSKLGGGVTSSMVLSILEIENYFGQIVGNKQYTRISSTVVFSIVLRDKSNTNLNTYWERLVLLQQCTAFFIDNIWM